MIQYILEVSKRLRIQIVAGIFLIIFSGSVSAQTWFKSETPRFRNANSTWMRSPANLVAVGGWLTNDSLTGVYTSTDSGKTWDFNLDDLGSQLFDVYFTSDQVGYACGKRGRFVKTANGGKNWTYVNLGGYATSLFRSITFSGPDSCWMVGGGIVGNQSLIVFSPDHGGTWKTLLDSNFGVLKSIAKAADNSLWASGINGLLYKSVDQGKSWIRVTPNAKSKSLNFNCIQFVDAKHGFIAGGSVTGDTVQYILGTTDGGANWTTLRDTVGPALNAVYFLSQTEGYAVGNLGAFINSSNAGINWYKVPISAAINDTRDLQDVFFINRYNGFAGGSAGKTLHYSNKNAISAQVKLNRIFFTSDGKVRFEGSLNAEGLPAKCYLHYGPDPDMKSTFFVGDFSGSSWQGVFATLSIPKGFYYARLSVTSDAGTNESAILTFYAGPSEIPNFDFELWNNNITEHLLGWDPNGIISRYDFGNGRQGLNVQAVFKADGPGAVLYGRSSNNTLVGGIPFKGKPKTINLLCRYNIHAGDSAFMFCKFKDISGKTLFNSNPKWTGIKMTDTVLSFVVSIPDTAHVDTIILAFVCTNVFTGKTDTASHLYLDSMWFTGTADTIPNMSFNQWGKDSSISIQSWYDLSLNSDKTPGIFRSTHAHSMKYSAHLFRGPTARNYPFLSSYPMNKGFKQTPSFALSQRYSTLNGYVHFKPKVTGDSFLIRGMFFKSGSQIGWCNYIQTAANNDFTPFTIPLNYSTADKPDSGSIQIYLYNGSRGGNASDAEAWVDQLSFENWMDSTAAGIRTLIPMDCKMYPNPANSTVTFEVNQFEPGTKLMMYTITGKQVNSIYLNTRTTVLDVADLPADLYVVVIQSGKESRSFKLVVGH